MNRHKELPGQLSFSTFLLDADDINRKRAFERETVHLPSSMDEALPFFRSLLEKHDEAMRAADTERVFALRKEARKLALRLDHDEVGILASEDAPACVLERLTAAPSGQVPVWGQKGEFVINAAGTHARIEMRGIFGPGGSVIFWPGFAAHCVDAEKPFISETGYRSFLGLSASAVQGLSPESFVALVLETHVKHDLKRQLVAIRKKYLSEG